MALSPEQRAAVTHDGNLALNACPGSGKTRTLVAKLVRCLDEVRHTPRRVAAITYTNAAAHEAETRINRQLGRAEEHLYEIGTIHAFCLKNILAPFAWRLPEWHRGFTIVPPDSDDFRRIAEDVTTDHGLNRSRIGEQYELLNRRPDGEPIINPPLTPEAAIDFWTRLQAEGLIDFSGLLYHSHRLLQTYPEIPKALSSRFAWILVDEFQDTNELQMAILLRIAQEERTRFLIVGDPNQSIFRFAGARPEHLDEFADATNARADIVLAGNYRSSTNIIEVAERLCPGPRPMIAIGPNKTCAEPAAWHHVNNLDDAIVQVFLARAQAMGIGYGSCAVLSPWFWQLFTLGRHLREAGVPIIGPGARPYKRRHLIAPLAEQVAAYVEDAFATSRWAITRELDRLITNTTGREEPAVFGREGRRALQRILANALRAREDGPDGREWLRRLAPAVADGLAHYQLGPSTLAIALAESVEAILSEVDTNDQCRDFSVADMAEFARPTNHVRLMTVHRAKGREFSAVALIDVHEGRYPHRTARSEEEIADGRRQLYVGATRAERLLMFFTESRARDSPSRFLREAGFQQPSTATEQ